jgi:type II secretory pathway predicted ATPase ExeA
MLTEIMDHFGLARGLRQAGYFETDHHQQLLKELEAAIRESGLVALAGMVGCGKTTLLWQLQDRLKKEGRFAIAESLAVDVDRVNLSTLKLALFYDLATEKDGEPPTKPEKSERALVKLILRHEKPIVLFVDDAHELHGQTLRSLKRIIERVRRRGGQLTIMLAGHPKLKNDLRRPTLEEIGARATVLELDGIKGQQKRFLLWLLQQCAQPKVKPTDMVTEEAIDLLAQCLVTPLQVEYYLTLALEHAYRFGEKTVSADVVKATMAPDINALEPTLTRYGYNVKALSELLNVRAAEIRALLYGQLPEERAAELKQQILKTGIPL